MQRLYTPGILQGLLGISEENSYRIMHVHGIKLGGRYYITPEKLDYALNNVTEIPIENPRPAKRTRPYTRRAAVGKG